MKTLTIFQITSSRNMSGGTLQAMLLSEGLAGAGHRVVFCAPSGSPALGWARGHGLECREFLTGKLWTQWKQSRRVRESVLEVGAEVVHAHHTEGHNVALLASFGGPFPPLVANRGVLFAPRFPTKFRSPRTGAIITNSRAVKTVLEKSGVEAGKIHVVYNARQPLDLAPLAKRAAVLREPLGLVASGPVIGTVGGGRPEKGFQFLVEAAPRILARFPSSVFVLVGTGTERLRPRLRALGLEGRFRLPGHRSDAVDIMALFDVFVIPSVGMESCPNVLLEAMSVGLPAVGADTGGIGEIIVDGVTGSVVAPGQPEALGEAVISILEDRSAMARMGDAGRRRIAAAFSLAAKLKGTSAAYENVLRR
jgi:glycosyltransferase involved in cell wall biosynthesis